jgi:hypothetical protein
MGEEPDKRKHQRVQVELPIRYNRYLVRLPVVYRAEPPDSEHAGVGWTRNLSESGMCVELDERLRPDTVLSIRLQTDRGHIEAQAQVVWAGEPTGIESGTPHGVVFTEMPPDQRQVLHDMLLPLSMVPHADVRLPLKIPITCQRKDQPGELMQGYTGNLSRGGILAYLPHAVPGGTVVAISLPTSKGTIRVEGTVTWVEPPGKRQQGQPIQHGLRFNFLSWSSSLLLGLLLAESK